MQVKFVGMDVHKNTVQVCGMSAGGRELFNCSVRNTPEGISRALKGVPKDASVYMESSSVWKAPFFHVRDRLGLHVELTNPYTTKLIAESKKKTDRVDARVLADMGRGGYLVTCHVPSREGMAHGDLVRFRRGLAGERTYVKNMVHGVLLQAPLRPTGTPFSRGWVAQVRALGDKRIESRLRTIAHLDDEIRGVDADVRAAVRNSEGARLLKTIPGVGDYSALVIHAEIDDIGRFVRAEKLCAYAGIVPSVRSSGDAVHYGRITRRGSSILRWVLVECVHTHARYAPRSDITVFYKRIAKKRGRGKAAVAAASLMLKVAYWMLVEKRGFIQNYSQDAGHDEHIEGEPRESNVVCLTKE